MMNPHEQSLAPAALPPNPHNRRRWFIAVVAGIAILGASGTFGIWYFTRCGNCGSSPILCDDPCTLPTFG
jgi:hypothetical protein